MGYSPHKRVTMSVIHDDLIKNLNDIVDFAFKGGKKKKDGNRKYITVTKFSTYWSQKKKGNNSFSKQQIKLLVAHLIKETYFQIGNLLFKQCIGIPMGIDPAPFWANLYLYVYEFRFIHASARTRHAPRSPRKHV